MDSIDWRARALHAESEVRRLQAERDALMRRFGLLPAERPLAPVVSTCDAEDDEGSAGDVVFVELDVKPLEACAR